MGNVAIFKGKLVKFLAKAGLLIPSRAQTDRSASPTAGELAHNSTSGKMEVYQGSAWQELVTTEGTQTINGIKSIEDKLNFTDASIVSSSFESVTNINSWKYEKSFSVAGQDTAPSGVFFSPDGTKMYILGDTDNDISQYNLSVAWDIGTATFFNQNGSGVLGESSPQDLYIRADGLKVFVVGASLDTVRRYSMSVAWDITTLTYDGVSSPSLATLIPSENTATGLDFSPDGTQMFVCGTQYDGVIKYTLSTAWDVSTATVSQQFSIATYDTGVQSIRFNDSGTIMYLLGTSKDVVYSYSLGTAWDISAPTLIGYHSIYLSDYTLGATQYTISSALGLFVSNNNAYVICSANDAVFQFNTTKPGLIVSGQDLTIKSPVHLQNSLLIAGSTKIDGSVAADGSIITGGDITVAGGDVVMTSTSNNIGYASTATNTLNISGGAVVSGSTKTINIGPNAVSGSTTTITLGSTVAGANNSTTVYGNMTVSGDLTVNGTTTTIDTTNLEVKDKNIVLNNGGIAASGGGSGIDIEENNAIVGYARVTSDRNGWEFKAPNSANIVTIPNSLAAGDVVLTAGNQTIGGTKTFSADSVWTSTGAISLPSGTTAQQPASPTNGMIRYNSSLNILEGYINGAWSGVPLEYSSSTSLGSISNKTIVLTAATAITATDIFNCNVYVQNDVALNVTGNISNSNIFSATPSTAYTGGVNLLTSTSTFNFTGRGIVSTYIYWAQDININTTNRVDILHSQIKCGRYFNDNNNFVRIINANTTIDAQRYNHNGTSSLSISNASVINVNQFNMIGGTLSIDSGSGLKCSQLFDTGSNIDINTGWIDACYYQRTSGNLSFTVQNNTGFARIGYFENLGTVTASSLRALSAGTLSIGCLRTTSTLSVATTISGTITVGVIHNTSSAVNTAPASARNFVSHNDVETWFTSAGVFGSN